MSIEHFYTGHGEGWIKYFLEIYRELKAPWQNLIFGNYDDNQHTIIFHHGIINAIDTKVLTFDFNSFLPLKRSKAIHYRSKNY